MPQNPDVPPEENTGLYDVQRLADYLGVKPATVRTLKKRHQVPAPTAENINGGAVWRAGDVKSFYAPSEKRVSQSEPEPDGPSVIDLFAGCGGLSRGFRNAGYNVLAGYDKMSRPCRSADCT